jgi:ABC-type Zn uptake system ZnuABC Zn-binding protein ZnuA
MKRIALLFAIASVLCGNSVLAADKLKVVTSTQDLASITREVGGDRVDVTSIGRGYQDPHFIEPKPSFLLLLKNADLLEVVGLELEIGWLPPLLDQSRNSRIRPGTPGYLDVSQGVEILDRPDVVNRSMGDVHPMGNPHYWLDPANAVRIAIQVRNRLVQLRPADTAYFDQRLQSFKVRINDANKRWMAQMAPYRGAKVVGYHPSLPNFARHFGLDIIGTIEPKPGIPPSPSHTLEIINLIKAQHVKAILMEPYFDRKTPDFIAAQTGAQVVVIYPSVGGKPGLDDYFKLFDYDINELTKALK